MSECWCGGMFSQSNGRGCNIVSDNAGEKPRGGAERRNCHCLVWFGGPVSGGLESFVGIVCFSRLAKKSVSEDWSLGLPFMGLIFL